MILLTAMLSMQARMTVKLAVAGAFHTDFMQPAVERLRGALASTSISTPRIPVISNVDAQSHSDPDTIRDILARQVGVLAGYLLLEIIPATMWSGKLQRQLC